MKFLRHCLLASSFHWKEHSPIRPHAVAGYSVGQYLALHDAGVLNRQDLITLVFKRCKAMNKAAEYSSGAMAAILGMRYEQVKKIALDQSVSISNNNSGNITVAGDQAQTKVCEIALKKWSVQSAIIEYLRCLA